MVVDAPLVFRPVYQSRVWGGRTLESRFGRALPDGGAPIGESWELVDRAEAASVVTEGPLAGRTLGDLWREERATWFGAAGERSRLERFPLLVKILDARETLSIQVHPPAEVAEGLGGEPKTEMWYVVAADPGASLYVGLRAGVTRPAFEKALREGRTDEMVHRIPVAAGNFLFIPSGRLHAIGAGLLIFEIQENSDTTYRVFDWNRVGLDGNPRALHVEESLRCIDFDDIEPSLDRGDGEGLVDCPLFRVERWVLPPGDAGRVAASEDEFAIFGVVSGEVRCRGRRFREGDFFLVPAGPGRARGDWGIAAGSGATLVRATLGGDGRPSGAVGAVGAVGAG